MPPLAAASATLRARVHMPRRAKTADADVELPPSRRHPKGGQRQRPAAAANGSANRRSGGQTGQRTSKRAPSVPRQEASCSDSSDETGEESPPHQTRGQCASTHHRGGGRSGQRTGQHAPSVRRQEGSSPEYSDESDEESPSRRSGGQHETDEESPPRSVGLLGVSSDGLWQSTGKDRAPSVPRQEATSSSESSVPRQEASCSESSEDIDEESQARQARGQGASTMWTDLGISLGLGAQPARGAIRTKPPRRAWTSPRLAFEKLAPASEAQATVWTTIAGRVGEIAGEIAGRVVQRCLQAWSAASLVARARCVTVLVLVVYALVRSQTRLPDSLRGLIVFTWS